MYILMWKYSSSDSLALDLSSHACFYHYLLNFDFCQYLQEYNSASFKSDTANHYFPGDNLSINTIQKLGTFCLEMGIRLHEVGKVC